MARKYYRRPFRRYHKPSYVVDRRIVNSGAWATHTSIPSCRVLSMQVVLNPENDRINPGQIKTVKHLEVQINTVPYWRYTDDNGAVITGVPSLGWILVYVPQTDLPKLPLGYDQSIQNNPLYEPNQHVLGHGTILQGGRDNDEDGKLAGYPSPVSPGNNMRIRCPVSKKLNPGDSIYLLVYALHCPIKTTLDVTECTAVVSYACRDNSPVCSKQCV